MPKNLTDADLLAIHNKADDLLQDLTNAAEQIKKMHVDKLVAPVKAARTFAILARNAANLSVFLLMQYDMQEQRAAINRLKNAAADA